VRPATQRLYFLDWLRIGAFALLVLYHVGMYYVTWSWHVKSADAGVALEPFMRLSSPWRLSLLFLISGAATSFMLLRDGASAAWFGGRSKRLLLPLLFGMAVIVPPQAYFEVVQQHGYAGNYLDFMRLYFSGYGGFCKAGGGCLILPTWNHLWFVAYLFVYTAALWGLLRLWPRTLDVVAHALARALRGAALLWLPIAVLALLRVTLIGRFPPTHALLDDAYLHAIYFGLFVVGAAWARDAGIWQRCAALRWPALGLALVAWVAMVVLPAWLGTTPVAREQWAWLARTLFAAMQWSAIVAAIGFARIHLDRDHRWRATLAESVFPVYIAHQTLIVLFAVALKPLRWAPALEGPLLAALTLLASFGVYLVVRRVPWLRSVFGLQAAARAAITAAPARVSAR
jgi:surface polysaccharide O-acyltransferase-like enzyme